MGKRSLCTGINHVIRETDTLQILRRDSPDTRRPAHVIMMFADVLAPNRRQAISNHHADFNLVTVW